jgi:hypothetical protein
MQRHTQWPGPYNYYGVRGNGHALQRFGAWTLARTWKWRMRRGGKRKRVPGAQSNPVLPRVKIARPRIAEVRRHRGDAGRQRFAPRM